MDKETQKQLLGLILVLDESPESFVHRNYVKEKLTKIIKYGEFSIHPLIKELLTDDNLNKFLNKK